MKKLTIKDKKSLLNKYPIKESQLDYEFSKCKKKGISIKDYLNDKYNKVHLPQLLYHYTHSTNLKDILNWGIIFGDTVTSADHLGGLNAPQLTTKTKFHNVTSFDDEELKKVGYIRITVRIDHDDKKLVKYRDYYASKGMKDGIANNSYNIKQKMGTLDEQHFYEGHIDSSMFVGIHKYDFRTQKWIKLE